MANTYEEYHLWIHGSGQTGPKIYNSKQHAAADNQGETAACVLYKRVTVETVEETWNMGKDVPVVTKKGTFASEPQDGTYRVFTPTKG